MDQEQAPGSGKPQPSKPDLLSLTKELKTLQDENEKWQVRVPKLFDSLKQKESEVLNLRGELKAMQNNGAKVADLEHEKQVGLLNLEVSQWKEKWTRMAESVQANNGSLDALEQKIRTVTQANKDLGKAVQMRDAQLETDKQAFTTLKSENETLEAARFRLAGELQNLIDKNATNKKLATSAESEKADLATTALNLQSEKSSLETWIGELETGRAELQNRIAELEADQSKVQHERDALEAQVSELQSGTSNMTGLASEREALVKQVAQLQQELAAFGETATTLKERDARIEVLNQEIEHVQDEANAQSEIFEATGREQDKSLQDLARDSALADKTLLVMNQQLEDARSENAGLAKRIAEFETGRTKPDSTPAKPSPSAKTDDLSKIRGIGEKVAMLLNRAGITTFAQIAAWPNNDLDALDDDLRRFAGPARRADWVGQAQDLMGTMPDSPERSPDA
ncbi:MAG: hypothetical protein O7H39_19000 [Gammaproteobacteria bacterium]|nr:hypothetical protein [Gammaproteobacteria bacterium]